MGKESFIIYTSFYKPISILSDKQLGRLFRAIFEYQLSGVVDVEEDIRMAFEFFKNQFEIDERKYQAKIKRNNENGHKGGNPNFRKGKSNPYYDKKENKITGDNPNITEDNPTLPNITEDKPIYDNDNDNGNDNSINSANPELCEQLEVVSPAVNADKKKNNIDYKRIINLYHSLCPSFPRIRMLSDARKQKLRIRFQDEMKSDISLLESIFRKMEESKFLRGDNKNGWKASFDWLFENSKNWVKVVEGNYDNRNVNNDVKLRQLDRKHPRLDLGTYAEDEYTETF